MNELIRASQSSRPDAGETMMTTRAVAFVAVATLLLAVPVARAVAQSIEVEPPATFAATQILPAELASGSHHSVDPIVRNDGFINHYKLYTRWGSFDVASTATLRTWVREIEVAAAIAAIRKDEEFLKNVDQSVRDTLRGAGNLLTNPAGTLGEAVEGVGLLFRRAGDSLFGDPRSENESSGLAALVGYTKKKREYANALGVDLYSRNPALQAELDALATSGYLGGLAATAGKIAIPGGVGIAVSVAGGTDLMQEAYRALPAADLRRLNRERLTEMGVHETVVNLFMRNTVYTPTEQTQLVTALAAIEGVGGRGYFVEAAVLASDPGMAGFRTRQAQMFAAYHEGVEPLAAFEPLLDERLGALLARTASGKPIFLVPLDHLAWTVTMARFISGFHARQRGRDSDMPLEIWFGGTASALARQNLETRRMIVREGVERELLGGPTSRGNGG